MENSYNNYERTEKILSEHIDQLHLLAETLVKLEKVNEEQFVSLMEKGELPEEAVKETPENVEETEVVEPVESTETSEKTVENSVQSTEDSDNV